MTELEIKEKLDNIRENTIVEIHSYNQVKGTGIIVDNNYNIYDYKWYIGYNQKENKFGMCNDLDKRDKPLDFKIKEFLEELNIFTKETKDNSNVEEGYDVIVKLNEKETYLENKEVYLEILGYLESEQEK